MARLVRLVALSFALLAQLPSLLATAGDCGDRTPPTMASTAGHDGSHDEHPAPTGSHSERSQDHGPEHCAMVSTCVSGCASESAIVAFRSSAPRIEHRLELDVRVPDSPLVSPEPPPPRG